MSKQEILQKVYDHFIKEGNPMGYDSKKSGCSYEKGCAIGIFLTPEKRRFFDSNSLALEDLYSSFSTEKEKEVQTAFNEIEAVFGKNFVKNEQDFNFLVLLQDIHDSSINHFSESRSKEYFLKSLNTLAKEHKLKIKT